VGPRRQGTKLSGCLRLPETRWLRDFEENTLRRNAAHFQNVRRLVDCSPVFLGDDGSTGFDVKTAPDERSIVIMIQGYKKRPTQTPTCSETLKKVDTHIVNK
jgi:hypothetical protein